MFKRNIQSVIVAVLALLIATPVLSQSNHDFLHDKYDAMHDSPMQQKFRQIAPMPFGVVFLPWAGCTEEDMRYHFRMMKELGFTNLKQTMATPEWPEHETLRIALEEDIIPFWYGEGGWELITPELLLKLGLPENMDIKVAREHPAMREYQKEVLYKHLEAWKKNLVEYTDKVYFHEPDAFLRPEDEKPFKNWVKQQYSSVKDLTNAWNHYEVGIKEEPYKTWEDFENDNLVKTIPGSDEIVPSAGREYGQVRDILRFKADMNIKYLEAVVIPSHPEQPVRAGGEMGLFLPFASRGTDMEGIAELMKDRGSFYPSIHLAWHFEEVDYEVAPAIYMQSSIATDWFKGGWAATWESTGGPQQFSGGKGWDRKGQEGTPGYTVNTGTMTQLLLSYLAGGFKGVGLWAWNYRRAGWESGEYALLNRQNEPTERTIRAGQIAKAADKYRDELWSAHKEPLVGVFVNWDNEAIWAAAAGPGRTHFKNYPVQARVGISRALINANMPWEYVTPSDLKAGLGPRYQIIYMPAQAAINENLLPIFEEYVKQGGRLVVDAPGGWWTEHGKVLDTGKGSAFERIFGASIADFQYSNNVLWKIDEHVLDGFVIDIKTTSAKVIESFQNNRPSVTVNKLGNGTAVILAADASFSMKTPGNDFMESWTLKHTLDGKESPYSCNAIVYRLAARDADHYFFINDDEPVMTSITFSDYIYKSFTDAVTGEKVDPSAIELEGYSGRWIRFEK
jgi:beta-galactosidase